MYPGTSTRLVKGKFYNIVLINITSAYTILVNRWTD